MSGKNVAIWSSELMWYNTWLYAIRMSLTDIRWKNYITTQFKKGYKVSQFRTRQKYHEMLRKATHAFEARYCSIRYKLQNWPHTYWNGIANINAGTVIKCQLHVCLPEHLVKNWFILIRFVKNTYANTFHLLTLFPWEAEQIICIDSTQMIKIDSDSKENCHTSSLLMTELNLVTLHSSSTNIT